MQKCRIIPMRHFCFEAPCDPTTQVLVVDSEKKVQWENLEVLRVPNGYRRHAHTVARN